MILEKELLMFFQKFLMERGIETDEVSLLGFNFVGSALLDSFEILTMIIALETEFSLMVLPDELVDEKNSTVRGLLKTLLTKSTA